MESHRQPAADAAGPAGLTVTDISAHLSAFAPEARINIGSLRNTLSQHAEFARLGKGRWVLATLADPSTLKPRRGKAPAATAAGFRMKTPVLGR